MCSCLCFFQRAGRLQSGLHEETERTPESQHGFARLWQKSIVLARHRVNDGVTIPDARMGYSSRRRRHLVTSERDNSRKSESAEHRSQRLAFSRHLSRRRLTSGHSLSRMLKYTVSRTRPVHVIRCRRSVPSSCAPIRRMAFRDF